MEIIQAICEFIGSVFIIFLVGAVIMWGDFDNGTD
jgi:hypothetical protein